MEKENGKWLGYEGNHDTLYMQLKKEVENSLNKLTVVIVSLSAICFLMTYCMTVSMPSISMAELDGIHGRFQISPKIAEIQI